MQKIEYLDLKFTYIYDFAASSFVVNSPEYKNILIQSYTPEICLFTQESGSIFPESSLAISYLVRMYLHCFS